jgi:ATP phosphoribosyltransferase regulatory subunit
MRTWLLPEYIEDLLPPEAERIEHMRRRLLDHFHAHGYLLVQPPLIEHLDSLLTGTGRDLDLRTFKAVDQLSGRLLGVRADITQQVSRIDAHLLNHEGITRLCYAGSVLHTRPAGLHQSRELIQIGAELYGHAGIESDREVLELLLSSLRAAGIARVHIDLGHVGVFRSMVRAARLDPNAEETLFTALQGKDVGGVHELTAAVADPWREALRLLPSLYGEAGAVLDRARRELPDVPELRQAWAHLSLLSTAVATLTSDLQIDLAELPGYHYQTGVVFAAYTPGEADAIARGGRFDDIGKAFGRARPATGFTLYPRQLVALAPDDALPKAILAPAEDDTKLAALIEQLRSAGEAVVRELPGEPAAKRWPACDRRIVMRDGAWRVTAINESDS